MISAPNAILTALSADNRRILSRWRSLVYLRRASNIYAESERRWINVPQIPGDMDSLLQRMRRSGQIESLDAAPGCYAVMLPFALTLPLREEEILLEANPYTVLTHYTAMAIHGFTLNRPNIMTAWAGVPGWTTPLGTDRDEWRELELPTIHRPTHVLNQEVLWFNRFSDFSFGVSTDHYGPIPIRITDRERTLIDALQWPEYAGGIANVIRAWDLAREFVDINAIVDYAARYEIRLLQQRVGYVAELLGFHHATFDQWAERSTRGGSNRLVGSQPFGPEVSSRWNLSINAPVEAFLS